MFALGVAGFGVLQLIYGDFIPGRSPPWPEEWPGRLAWAYATGAFWLVVGVALGIRRLPRGLVLVAIALIAVWSLARLGPIVFTDAWLGGSWTRAGKAVVLIAGLLALNRDAFSWRAEHFRWVGCIGLGAFLILAGLQHFRWDEFVATLVPTWVPGGAYFWTYASAILLLSGGIGLLVPRFTSLAALLSGLMIFLWVLTLHLPRAWTFADQNEWTAVCEAIAFSGLAFALVSSPEKRCSRDSRGHC